MLLVCVVSVFLLALLYDIRLKHHRFSYGIFSAFGADFGKIYLLCICEIGMISLMTFLPAMLLSIGILLPIYRAVNVTLSLPIRAGAQVLLFYTVTVLAAIYLPVKVMLRGFPSELLRAKNNAQLVSSPKRSFRMLEKRKKVWAYESMSVWRFRRYYTRLIVSAASFCILFLCCIYMKDLVHTHQAHRYSDFTISVAEEIDQDTIDLMDQIDGVDYVLWSNTMPGTMRSDHLLLTREQVGMVRTNCVRSEEVSGFPMATNRFVYTAWNRQLLDIIVRDQLFEIEGDPYSIFDQENTIIISDSVNNSRVFDFHVGDQVTVAQYVGGSLPPGKESQIRNEHLLLTEQIKHLDFEYNEYTIGAIIHDNMSGQEAIFGVSEEEYALLADTYAVCNRVEIYLEEGIDHAKIESVRGALRELGSTMSGYQMESTYATFDRVIANQKQLEIRLMILAMVILAMCPLMWLYSQTQFFAYREGEWQMLGMYGISDSDVKRIHGINGFYAAVGAILVTMTLSHIACWLLFRFCNFFLTAYGFGDGTKYVFQMSFPALAICACLAVVFGYLSSLLPYYRYMRRKKENKK